MSGNFEVTIMLLTFEFTRSIYDTCSQNPSLKCFITILIYVHKKFIGIWNSIYKEIINGLHYQRPWN